MEVLQNCLAFFVSVYLVRENLRELRDGWDQSHYLEVPQGGVSSIALQN